MGRARLIIYVMLTAYICPARGCDCVLALMRLFNVGSRGLKLFSGCFFGLHFCNTNAEDPHCAKFIKQQQQLIMIITTRRIPDDAIKVGALTWCVSKKLIPLLELEA